MNRIKKKFQELKEANESALVGFVTAGDPDPDKSLEIINAMCRSGLDVLELGIPFSDPSADGPVIQRSSMRALKAGMTLPGVLKTAAAIRKNTDIPIILFSYYNPIFAYGIEKFCKNASEAGADGVLVVDLPPEESDELTRHFSENFSIIRLIAPTTPKERMEKICKTAGGFLYLVSKTGVTGSDGLNTKEIKITSDHLSSLTSLPVCIGFGISTTEDVSKISSFSDGVVIGSAFERIIEEKTETSELVATISKQVSEYKKATKKQK